MTRQPVLSDSLRWYLVGVTVTLASILAVILLTRP